MWQRFIELTMLAILRFIKSFLKLSISLKLNLRKLVVMSNLMHLYISKVYSRLDEEKDLITSVQWKSDFLIFSLAALVEPYNLPWFSKQSTGSYRFKNKAIDNLFT